MNTDLSIFFRFFKYNILSKLTFGKSRQRSKRKFNEIKNTLIYVTKIKLIVMDIISIYKYNDNSCLYAFGIPIIIYTHKSDMTKQAFEHSQAKTMMLKKLLNSRSNNKKTAIFGVMPPEQTGIALFNAENFCDHPGFDIFTNNVDLDRLAILYKYCPTHKNIYSNEVFELTKEYNIYSKNIFVVGNSHHNLPYLKAAYEEKNKNISWIHVHDGNLTNLLFHFYGCDLAKFKQSIAAFYPEKFHLFKDVASWDDVCSLARKNSIYGIRAIYHETNIKNFIANNDGCRRMIEQELSGQEFFIKKAFLSIPDLREVSPYPLPDGSLYIGTFGIPSNEAKQTDKIIEAVRIYNELYHIDAKVVIAGYDTQKYYQSSLNESQQQIVIPFDSPDDKTLYSLMKRVDLAVQLRTLPLGESSGPISQLIGMNKKVIASENFVDSSISSCCSIVEQHVTPEALCESIKKELLKPVPDHSKVIDELSDDHFRELILEI